MEVDGDVEYPPAEFEFDNDGEEEPGIGRPNNLARVSSISLSLFRSSSAVSVIRRWIGSCSLSWVVTPKGEPEDLAEPEPVMFLDEPPPSPEEERAVTRGVDGSGEGAGDGE